VLRITIPAEESWDEKKEEFVITRKEQTLQLEHSLVSLSKWESKWHKPFLSKVSKTDEEILDYIKCMTITQNVDPEIYYNLTPDNYKQINDYIDDPQTATSFSDTKNGKSNRDVVTAEVVYYWMIALNIPPEYQKWHLNRLLTLIKVCNIKNSPPKKRSAKEIMAHNKALNDARRKQLHTKG
jgi:hypothetical protein